MFSLNECVFYSAIGICQVVDIRPQKLGCSEAQPCYVLKPIYDPGSIIYVPVDQVGIQEHMRQALTKDEIYKLIHDMPDMDGDCVANERERDNGYYAKLRSCDARELVKIIKSLYFKKKQKTGPNKYLTATDAQVMTVAEKLLYEEFAFVLGIEPGEVVPFILERIP